MSEALAAWCDEAARYFENLPTNGEDSAHWANVYNALNARSAANALRNAPDERLYHLHVEALAEIKASVDGKSDQPVRDIIYGLLAEINEAGSR